MKPRLFCNKPVPTRGNCRCSGTLERPTQLQLHVYSSAEFGRLTTAGLGRAQHRRPRPSRALRSQSQPACSASRRWSNVFDDGTLGDVLQLGNSVVGDLHLLEPRDERRWLLGFPITEDFAFGQVGKAFVAFDIRILLGGGGDLTELFPR